MGKRTQTFERLSDDMVKQINDEIAKVVQRTGFGEVTIVVEEGVPKWLRPAPSIPLREPMAMTTV